MAFSHIATGVGMADGDPVTAAINSSGATLLVAVHACYGDPTWATVSDSKGNTWTALTPYVYWTGIRIWYCLNPTSVGSSHTATVVDGAGYDSLALMAFGGESAIAFDVENGFGKTTDGTTIQPGSVTPSVDNCLLVTGVTFTNYPSYTAPTVNSSFTRSGHIHQTSGGGSIGVGYKIQTTAGAENPTWTHSTANYTGQYDSASIAVFKPLTATQIPFNNRMQQYLVR